MKNEVAAAFGGSANSISSIINNYSLILLSFPVSILIAVAFMLLIKFTAKLFIYMVIVFSIGALLGMGVYMLVSSEISSITIFFSTFCFSIAFFIVLVVYCIRRRLALASIIIKVAAKFISENCLIVLLPVGLFVLTVFYLVLWVLQSLGFYSLGTPTTS
jgi:hypothetical protein